ncbi:MAG: hypothetical protein JWP57_4133 [Spirosoma sp.]|nr:hypothetical protein [Spirosoma sp.]
MIYDRLTTRGIEGSLAIDIGSVLWGRRPVGLSHIPSSRLDAFLRILGELRLAAFVSRRLQSTIDAATGQFRLSDEGASRDHNMCEVWFSKERLDDETVGNLVKACGESLSYPQCCIDNYSHEMGFSRLYAKYASDSAVRNWRLNRFASIFDDSRLTLDYLPCSLHCSQSAGMAADYASFLEAALGQIELAKRTLRNRMTYGLIDGMLVRFSKFVVEGENFVVDLSNIVRSSMRLGTDLGDAETGLLLFDSNLAEIGLVKRVIIQSERKIWRLLVKII